MFTAATFSGTTSFDFYSAPLTASGAALTGADRAGAEIWVSSPGSTQITVHCRASFFDFDPATGGTTQIVGTGFSGNVNVAANGSGHRLKLTVTISFVTGNFAQIPGFFEPVLDVTTAGIRLHERALVMAGEVSDGRPTRTARRVMAGCRRHGRDGHQY